MFTRELKVRSKKCHYQERPSDGVTGAENGLAGLLFVKVRRESSPLLLLSSTSYSPSLLLRACSVFSKQILFLLPPSATIMAGFQSYDNFSELYHLKLSRIKSLALWNINDIRNERFNVMGKLLICTFYISLPLFLIYCNKLNWERRNSSTMERPAAPSV